MENLLENYGEALQTPPISVESDEPIIAMLKGIIAMLKGELLRVNVLCITLTYVMAGNLRLSYAIFVSTFTQEKLKKNEDVILPINESTVMKAKLTEWISKAVCEMQQVKEREENILGCYQKTSVTS